MKSIVLYGLKSEKEAYQCTRYEILGCERMSVTDLLFTAGDFADHYGVNMVCVTIIVNRFERVTPNRIPSTSSCTWSKRAFVSINQIREI